MSSSVPPAEFWSQEKEQQLIELWQTKPCLYDCSSKGYANRNKKNLAHEDIASKLGTTGALYHILHKT